MTLLNSKITRLSDCASEQFDGAPPDVALKDLPSMSMVSGNTRERTSLLCSIRRLEEDGNVKISLECLSDELRMLDAGGPDADELCGKKNALWNIRAYASEWATHPEYNDFMQVGSPVFFRKKLQAAIYAELIKPYISQLSDDAKILDAGAGVGRLVPTLAATGAELHLADSSEKALKTAWRELCSAGVQNYDLHRLDASDLSCFEDGFFDVCIAIELLCYLHDPASAAKELARVCKPGGVVILSVENKAGAVLGDGNLSIYDIAELSGSDTLYVPGYCYTKYYTRETASALAEGAGLNVMETAGCHFIADGPFDHIFDEQSLSDPDVFSRYLAAERACRTVPEIENIGRAWFSVAKKCV